MFKKNLLVAILTFTVTLAACGHITIPADEDYRVYSAVLRQTYTGAVGVFVIDDQTSLMNMGIEDAGTLTYLQENEPAITAEMYSNLVERNRESLKLERKLDLPGEYVYLSNEEFQQFFAGDNVGGWDTFYVQYPDSTGMIYLSRPGYNAAGDRAIVYFGNQAYYLAGAGYIVLLEKLNGEWQIVNQVMIWIS